jgi:hypothetical protein
MDNSNTLSSLLVEKSESIVPTASISPNYATENSTSFFDFFTNINLTTWIIIVLILAFLGFNVFVYLAKGTQDITNFFSPILNTIFGTAVEVTGQTVDVAVGGTANAIQEVTPNHSSSKVPSQPVEDTLPHKRYVANDALDKALNHSQNKKDNHDYEAHEASSSILKSGWCYIGEDRGFRSCSEVGPNDMCMSGDIFPSNELCVNPNLRM